MSFKVQPAGPARPNRCQLFGPGSRPAIFEKMAASAADVINLDLEDSVAPADKAQARKNIIEAVNDIDWGTKTLSVRINGLDTEFWHHDVVDLIEKCGDRLDLIMIPKVGNAMDIYAVDAVVTAAEMAVRKTKKIGFEVIIETAAGAQNVDEIAAASPRMNSMSFGVADYAASMGMAVTGIGGTQDEYYMLANGDPGSDRATSMVDPWHYPITRMVAACRQHGLLPVDGPFGDFSDDDGYAAQAKRSATLGCVGKWAIHPKQVTLANEVFTPPAAKVEQARRILAAMQEAEEAGQGAAVLDGKLIDLASSRQAQVIVKQAELISAAG
ncbi:MAG: CoA ester lyase [Paracoccaceae bacterium]|nr:CoA ester lyase [Paracoccaceae bacterium]MDG1373444.1 CoA ester lyase [Paracoccaceae bacterium]